MPSDYQSQDRQSGLSKPCIVIILFARLCISLQELGNTQAEKTKLQAALDEAMAATKPAEAEMDAVKQMMGELKLKNKDLAQQIKSLQEDDMNALRRSSQEKLGSAFPNKVWKSKYPC